MKIEALPLNKKASSASKKKKGMNRGYWAVSVIVNSPEF
uniref:Uncharacterized protein n=1 Tax=Arundo donax TaxID=35708 RepID=A0A0A9BKW0_ARUDO